MPPTSSRVYPYIKMYNGIGLETARGSGTNGYVQRNASFVRAKRDRVDYKTEEQIAKAEAHTRREPNQGIIDHERKRRLEVRNLVDCQLNSDLIGSSMLLSVTSSLSSLLFSAGTRLTLAFVFRASSAPERKYQRPSPKRGDYITQV